MEAKEDGVKLIDQDIPPFVIVDDEGKPKAPIQDDDVVIFFNFRGDRAIEISRAFTESKLTFPFVREPQVQVHYAGMMEYDGDRHIPPDYLVEPPEIDRTIVRTSIQSVLLLVLLALTRVCFPNRASSWPRIPFPSMPLRRRKSMAM